MYTFKQFMMNAQKQKRCPDGYRFDKALNVCVPIGVTRYYPYFGGRGNGDQHTETSNGNGQNGNGAKGNGANGNGVNGGGTVQTIRIPQKINLIRHRKRKMVPETTH